MDKPEHKCCLRLFQRLRKSFVWSRVRGLGNTKILRSSYIWLIVVPIMARGIDGVNKESIALNFISPDFKISLSLPFSWKIFYLSAVCIAVANTLYWMLCPSLVKRFNDYSAYLNEGRGEQIRSYVYAQIPSLHNTEAYKKLSISYPDQQPISPEKRLEYVQNLFWDAWAHENTSKRWGSGTALILYWIGLALLVYIAIENSVYVWKASI